MIILAIVLLILVGVVAFLNTEMLLLNLYFMSLSSPAWLVFLGFLGVGMLIAALFATSKGARNRQVIKNKKEEVRRVEEEKEEVIERMQKEKDLQLELQSREAEIKNLEAKLAEEETHAQPLDQHTPIDKEQVVEYQVDEEDTNQIN